MFTGIITDIGHLRSTQATGANEGEGRRFEIETVFDMNSVDIGASISCSGACMTVVEKSQNTFAIEVSAESLSKTTLGDWAMNWADIWYQGMWMAWVHWLALNKMVTACV